MATTSKAKKSGVAKSGAASRKTQSKLTPKVKAAIKQALFAGKGMTACHTMLFKTQGIWIPELVPAFKKLDKMLGLR